MSLLPDGRQAGLFIKAPMTQVMDCLVSWGGEVGRATKAEMKRGSSIQMGWDFVGQRAFIPYRAFLIGAGAWTAFFDNHSREFLAQAELFILCDRLSIHTSFFGCPEDETSSHFCFFRKDGSSVKERQVMVYQEGTWVFSETGEPLPFEDLAAYKRPKNKDRLTREMLLKYAQHLEVPLGDAAQFGPDLCLLHWRDFNQKK